MLAIDYARFALVLERCAEIANAESGKQIVFAYESVLKESAEAFLTANQAVALAEKTFERDNKALVEAMNDLAEPYTASLRTVKKHFPSALLPESVAGLPSLLERGLAVEALLNILDDSIVDATWAAEEMTGAFGAEAPRLLRELGEAAMSHPTLGAASEARARAYAPAYERHRVFKRVVRRVQGPQSGHYQSIHWRSAWGQEGVGPVSWGPYSFRAPLRNW